MKRNSTNLSEIPGFSPVRLKDNLGPSPSKNLTGSPRIARDIAADLFNNIQRWNSLHINGCLIVKQIASMKSDDSGLSKELEDKANELYSIVQDLKLKKEFFELLITQSDALSNLGGSSSQPLFLSMSTTDFARIVKEVCLAYIKEFQMKEFVQQNIALDKDKNNAMFLAACWTHQLNITDAISFKLESLLVETNHRPII